MLDTKKKKKTFMLSAAKIIRQNLGNCKFTVSEFAREMHTTRMCLKWRIKKSTGFSPADYLLDYRLRVAANLLLNSDYCVEDISRMVGIKGIKEFSDNFREKYGKAPLEYRNSGRESDTELSSEQKNTN